MQGVAGVFVEAGSIPQALESYDATVNPEPLRAATGG
jgi:taurine transport system substrate-binding protein